jgi:hypothetical protein
MKGLKKAQVRTPVPPGFLLEGGLMIMVCRVASNILVTDDLPTTDENGGKTIPSISERID